MFRSFPSFYSTVFSYFGQHIAIFFLRKYGINTYPDRPDPAKWCGSDPIRESTALLEIVIIFFVVVVRLSFEELGEHPFLELEYSVPGPNTLARLNIALDAATAAGKVHSLATWCFLLDILSGPCKLYFCTFKDRQAQYCSGCRYCCRQIHSLATPAIASC